MHPLPTPRPTETAKEFLMDYIRAVHQSGTRGDSLTDLELEVSAVQLLEALEKYQRTNNLWNPNI